MKIDECWYNLYEKLYGKKFNRFLTIGNIENGYENYNIRNIKQMTELIEETPQQNEFYISLYNFKTDENILRWNSSELNKYEKFAEKRGILFRFKENTDIIQEEIVNLPEIQKFMFIRRSINLGSNKKIVKECLKVYNFFKNHFNIKGQLVFNGYDECLLYYKINILKLSNPSLTFYNINKLLKEKLELETLLYENIEPFAQIVPLLGSQNYYSRLYTQVYSPENSYEEIMLKGQEKFINESEIEEFETSADFQKFIKDIDKKISESANNKYDFDKIWNKI